MLLEKPEVDEEVIHVASTAAIIYTKPSIKHIIQNSDKSCGCGKDSELVGRYLTKTEKVMERDAGFQIVQPGKIRAGKAVYRSVQEHRVR